MGVSENGGTPKSSILIGFSIINHPFWGTPIFGNTHIPYNGAHWDTSHLLPVEVVTLTGNPLKALRQALVAKGWSAVAQHLRKQRLEVQGLSRKNWRAGDSGMRDDGGCLQHKGLGNLLHNDLQMDWFFGYFFFFDMEIGRSPPKLRQMSTLHLMFWSDIAWRSLVSYCGWCLVSKVSMTGDDHLNCWQLGIKQPD